MKKFTALTALLLSIIILMTACDKEPSSSGSSDNTTTAVTQESTSSPITTETTSADTSPAVTTSAVTDTVPAVSILPNITSSRYGYYKLNADEKAVYDQLVTAADGFQKSVVLKRKLNRDTVKKIMAVMHLEENDLYYISGDYEINVPKNTDIVSEVFFRYLYTKTEVENLNKAVEAKISEIFKQIPANASPITKIKIFHDQIILNCTYDLSYEYGATPYGALVAGDALCEGYARAFALLCSKAGIENLFATGSYKDEAHIWNMVKLDGDWYNIDLTWDDPPKNGDDLNPDYYIEYSYFLYKNGQSGVNLIVDSNWYTVPETPSSKYNYFIYNGYFAKSYEQAVQILGKQIKYALENNKKYVRVRFSTEELYNETISRLFGDSQEIFNEAVTPAGSIQKYGIDAFDSLHILQLELFPE